jgi:MFS family permease
MVSAVIDTGIDKMAAASIFALASLASVPGRVGTGLLADRFVSKVMLVTWLALQAIAIALYLCIGGFGGFALLAVLFGLSYGGVMPLYALVAREFFGAQAMGASYGGVFMLSCIGMGLGAWFGGWIFDSLQTYEMMYILGGLSSAMGAVLATQLRTPQRQQVWLSRAQPQQVS